MPLQRVLEPEVMDTAEEASDYNSMDHSAVNVSFVKDLLQFVQANHCQLSSILDLGTGTALIPIELCKSHSSCCVTAIDMAEHMLSLADQNVQANELQNRITLRRVDAKKLPFRDGEFDAVVTNSIVHHIPEPASCARELVRVTSAGGIVFVRDLMRPDSDEEVARIVTTYAGEENDHSRKMFDDSLRAALSLKEIQDIANQFGFDPKTVSATSDRHWTWAAVKSD